MNECFVVVHQNHAEGMTACVFRQQADAENFVATELDRVTADLKKKGLRYTVEKDGWDNVSVRTKFGGVHYEWSIIISEIN